MTRLSPRLSRPLYEGLPWIYIAGGVAALAVSYFIAPHAASSVVGVLGFLCVLGGVVVLLRRRDYRQLRSQYGNPESLTDRDEP